MRGSDHTEMRGDTESALIWDNIPLLADKPFERDTNPDPQPNQICRYQLRQEWKMIPPPWNR